YLGYTRQQWKITSTESGGLRIKAKSAEGLEKDLVVTAGFTFGEIINWTDGVDVEQREYLDNDSYKDEWIFVRRLPTNGFELDYPSNASQYVQNCNNCYAYAINNQVFPGTNLLWGKQQMGEYSGSVYSDLTEEAIYDAVSNDYQKYNLDYMAGLSFERIGKYDVCSPGTYKVALVAGVGNNGTPDYHWYRQDSDGLWSHKQGTTPIKRTDYSGDVIIDPEYADRGGYTEFLGYYEVSPWSNLHNPTTSTVYCMGFLFTYDDWLRNLYA
ncbi:MAG: hypothetical protein IJ274_05400, partial [Lachnospiraceae bacterium]|nr:hypothetical protein [Lachnospiraceae bacterium]